MSEFLIPVLLMIAPIAAVFLLNGPGISWFGKKAQKRPKSFVEPVKPPDPERLNCRVRFSGQINDKNETLIVQIWGTIRAGRRIDAARAEIFLADVTDGEDAVVPVKGSAPQYQQGDQQEFFYSSQVGKLPAETILLSDWMAVAQIDSRQLLLPRRGARLLRAAVCLVDTADARPVGRAQCLFEYDNPQYGYLDLQEGLARTKTLAVAIGFAVAAADGKMAAVEIELVKNWARDNIDLSGATDREKRKFERALGRTVWFFRGGGRVEVGRVCSQIAEFAPPGWGAEVLQLAMRVAAADGCATAKELAMLKDIARYLEPDSRKTCAMAAKWLPVSIHEVRDIELVTGVSADMNKEEARRKLNDEYRRWNARVTSSSPHIRSQAEDMLRFIAEARSACAT